MSCIRNPLVLGGCLISINMHENPFWRCVMHDTIYFYDY